MIAVPTVATWGRVEHRRHTELAKLPDTKTVLLLHSSALVQFGTGPNFHSFRVNIQKSTRRVRGPLAAASTSGLSAPPCRRCVTLLCVRGEVWNAAPVAAHCRLSLWYVRVDTEVHSFVQEFNSLTQLRGRERERQ